MIAKPPKPKTCQHCGTTFHPQRMAQRVCSIRCAGRVVRAERKAAVKAVRVKTKARKLAIKTIPDLIREAQKEFNAYIRLRDTDKPCICCGKPLIHLAVGGGYDCGHYRSVGSAPGLRFTEDNAHGQRKVCNRWGAGRAVDYRIGLIARIGLEAVETLEADNAVHKWTRDELIAIRGEYKAKRKALEAA